MLISGLGRLIPQLLGFYHLRIKPRVFAGSWPRLYNVALNPAQRLAVVLDSPAVTGFRPCPLAISATSCYKRLSTAHSPSRVRTDRNEPRPNCSTSSARQSALLMGLARC